jgi:hypothetical protein
MLTASRDAANKDQKKNPLSGCQKRKKKRCSKLAGSETEKAKQDSAVDGCSKQVAAEPKTYFEEEKRLTLDEYEKVREEKKKSLEATTAAVRKISAEEFKGLQLLEKADEEEAVKKAERVKPKEKTQSKGGESDAKKPPSSRLSTLTTPSSASSA